MSSRTRRLTILSLIPGALLVGDDEYVPINMNIYERLDMSHREPKKRPISPKYVTGISLSTSTVALPQTSQTRYISDSSYYEQETRTH